MKTLLRAPTFWILFTIVSSIMGIIAFYYFPQANSIIYLNLTMNRTQAIQKSNVIAQQFGLGPSDPWHAAQFQTDERTKIFVELEAGGKDAFVAMMQQNLYQPYNWVVRRFKPFEHHELQVYFTPDGIPYGFEETISEDTVRTNITPAQANDSAIAFAQLAPWNINFSDYTLVETSQETQSSGRLDHIFTYERTNAKIGEGFYRLKIMVSGDRVSALIHSIKVPDAFIRRYEQMRSANTNIAYAANVIMMLLYVIGCCFIGLFFLIRKRWVIWKTPFYWGMFIALLLTLNIPNQLPLAWMSYNTALSPIGFIVQQAIVAVYTFLLFTLACALIFMAAESLSRRAFGHHLQFWRLYAPSVANTYTVLGYTLSGYLLTPIMLCYTVLFYVITMRFFGWWNPSSVLFNPDILATYVPWLEPIATSLQAGFLEECLFRAVPLASAALLGNRFGKRTWWIAGAFILQAIVFGAAHANYPAQPAYARLVELLLDSALFGTIYLWLGLLPAIIMHYVYDIFWTSLPIFVSTAPGAFLNKVIILACASIPFLIVLVRRYMVGTWQHIQPSMLNSAWQPPIEQQPEYIEQPPAQIIIFSKKSLYITSMLGVLGCICWILFMRFSDDAPSFTTSRSTAQALSTRFLHDKNINTASWYSITYPFTHYEQKRDINKQHRFIWQEGGKDLYHHLIQSYLTPPHWITRFVTFDGSIEERTEEHLVHLLPNGSLLRYTHKIPETTAGASLTQVQAQARALAAIEQQFNISADQLREVSTVVDKQPARLDWVVTYAHAADYPLLKGEARIVIKIAGDQIIDAYRYIHVPEQWQRSEDNRLLFTLIINQICKLALYLITIIGAVIALLQWRIYSIRALIRIFLILSIIFLFDLFNSWPIIVAEFITSQPFYDQIFRAFPIAVIAYIIQAGALAIMINFTTYIPNAYRCTSFITTLANGICIGICLLGLQAALTYLLPSLAPLWANYTPLQSVIPLIAGINFMIIRYLSVTILLLLCVICMNSLTHYGTQRSFWAIIMSIIAGYISAGLLYADNIIVFSYLGIAFALFFFGTYYIFLRFNYSVIPVITATYMIGENIQQLFFHGYNLVPIIALASAAIIAFIASKWSQTIDNFIGER